METLLSTKTSALCFNKDDFMVKDFSVDKFVSNCRKYVSLETMLEDLGLYHKILCSAMIELLNKDYTDFLNLSSNLVGLDKSIKNLSLPLEKLKGEIEDMKSNLDVTLHTAKSKFSDYVVAHKTKVLAHHVICVLNGLKKIEELNFTEGKRTEKEIEDRESLASDLLERIALDFNLVHFHMSKISGLKKVEDKKMVVEEVANGLAHHLEHLFLQSLSGNDAHSLCKVLRIYAVINSEREVEKHFAQNIVKPYMQKHITEGNILKWGLAKVYDNVLDFISHALCKVVLDVTVFRGTKRYTEVVPGYDFLVNAVFPEIVCCFELIAPVHVYAPGDPNLFHKNYSASILFLIQFEQYCEVQTSVERLWKHESYRTFIKKWNLDVYFQIRFQEIAGTFENSLYQTFILSRDAKMQIELTGKKVVYLLSASYSVSECIKLCWDESIYLQPLSHNYFRLTLQLISRFNKYIHAHLNRDKVQDISPLDAAMIIRDVEHLILELKELFIKKICPQTQILGAPVKAAFEESVKSLEDIIPISTTHMIKSLTKQCCAHLKLITDIPRLYRKTNREIPSKPSPYVSLVFHSLTDFLAQSDSILSVKQKQVCLQEVTSRIIIQCASMIHDVLTSIKKMEDSLKILKRARDKPSGQTSSGTVTDNDKILHQLAIDINSFEETVQNLGLDVYSIKCFKELKELVSSSGKKNCSRITVQQ